MLQFNHILKAIAVVLTSTAFLNAQVSNANYKETVSHYKLPESATASDYMANTIIVKVKPSYGSFCTANGITSPAFQALYASMGGSGIHKKFRTAKAPVREFNEQGLRYADLTRIYEFNFAGPIEIEKVIDKFMALGIFEYAEPHVLPKLCYTPNDPSLGLQYAITKIQAPAAWGVNTTTARGDTNVVIGITDTGVQPNHPDLIGNIKRNYADPIGGGDNDSDGYIDNYSGWDIGEDDNNPSWNSSQHGVHVSGIAAASTDKLPATGIAGVGFNCKFMPIKIDDAAGALVGSYEGITYAAEHGCFIINCSWGGPVGGSMGQDVITYATINMNSLVVAASGNNGSTADFYPASFQYVVSVANTNNSDVAAGSTNYGFNIDVCAPGEGIYATYPTSTYTFQSGTSMASPCAAGAAAIIKSFYPSYNALQVGEQLKVTCDNIYPVNTATYANRLGYGRVNLFKALTITSSPSVVSTSMAITDNNDDAFQANDTLRFRGNYTNYLANATNVTATLNSASPYVTVLDGSATLGPMATMATANNTADPFTVRILGTAPVNAVIIFRLILADAATGYSHTEYIPVSVNVDYVNIAINDVASTISSTGKLGYRADGQVGGLGFTYMGGGTLLYEAGLMVGNSSTKVSDVVRGTGATSDTDFSSLIRAHQVVPAVESDFDVYGQFRDNTSASPLPVTVRHSAYAWTSAADRKYIMVKYAIVNTGASALSNVHAGIFADWDVDATTFGSNKASFDAANKMGYCWYTGASGLYVGTKLLTSSAPVVHYAIDNVSGGAGGIDMFTGYDTGKKFTTLSTNRANAGVAGSGVDVANVVSSGPYSIPAGDSVIVAFALIAGDDLADIQASAAAAQIMWDGMSGTTAINNDPAAIENVIAVYPNPTSDLSTIDINLAENQDVKLTVYNMVGQEIGTIVNGKLNAGTHRYTFDTSSLSNGMYYYQLNAGAKKYTYKLMVAR